MAEVEDAGESKLWGKVVRVSVRSSQHLLLKRDWLIMDDAWERSSFQNRCLRTGL